MENIAISEKRQISIDPERIVLGVGYFGQVLKGKFNGCPVAVKRVLLHTYNVNEENAMQMLDHPNIVKLFHCESDSDFM